MKVSRIRCPRGSDPRAFTAQQHRAGHLVSYTEPEYPAAAKEARIEGSVLLDALIDREGVVQTVTARSGHPWLAESSAESVRRWRYRPAKLNGIAVEVVTEIEVRFTLPDEVVSG